MNDSGVGGEPANPPSARTIIIQDEGVNVAGTPHKTVNFEGAGVDATDEGGDVAKITIPGAAGGSGALKEY